MLPVRDRGMFAAVKKQDTKDALETLLQTFAILIRPYGALCWTMFYHSASLLSTLLHYKHAVMGSGYLTFRCICAAAAN